MEYSSASISCEIVMDLLCFTVDQPDETGMIHPIRVVVEVTLPVEHSDDTTVSQFRLGGRIRSAVTRALSNRLLLAACRQTDDDAEEIMAVDLAACHQAADAVALVLSAIPSGSPVPKVSSTYVMASVSTDPTKLRYDSWVKLVLTPDAAEDDESSEGVVADAETDAP